MAEHREKWRVYKEREKWLDDTLAEMAQERLAMGRARRRAKIDEAKMRGMLDEFLAFLEQKGIDPESPDGRRLVLRWMGDRLREPASYRAAFSEGFGDQ